jgi:hypothetical protein
MSDCKLFNKNIKYQINFNDGKMYIFNFNQTLKIPLFKNFIDKHLNEHNLSMNCSSLGFDYIFAYITFNFTKLVYPKELTFAIDFWVCTLGLSSDILITTEEYNKKPKND